MNLENFNNYRFYPDGTVIGPRGKPLKPDPNTTGYLRVTLSKNGKIKRIFVHRLVATIFVDNPDNLPHVNHINGNRQDNRAENLEWCTPSYNVEDGYRRGRIHPLTGKRVKKYFEE